MRKCLCASETEQMLYSSAEVSSSADENLKVCLSVPEAHRAQLLQLVVELLDVGLTGQDRTGELIKVLLVTITVQ